MCSDKYGHDRVGHIIALGSLQARAAVRDVGRVMQLPLGLVDRIAKLIPNPPGKSISLREAIDNEPRLQHIAEQEPLAGRLFAIVEKIEGLYRHASTHPAGVVIGDRPLDEIVPLYRDPRSEMPVTQFDYEDAEKAGLVKFDFLGLKTLTVIAKAEELLKRRGIDVDTQNIDFDDKATFEMLARGESVGVFQLEGPGMRDLMRKMKPDHINDLVALVALYRPGPMESIPKYIACKHGKEAGISAPDAGADPRRNLRRDDVSGRRHAHRARAGRLLHGRGRSSAPRHGQENSSRNGQAPRNIHQGRGRKGVLPYIAEQIFEQAAKFAGYGFNKGHAAAYAQVAYQTAYLKANYPVEFLAASMTLDIGNTDRLNIFRQEAARLAIEVLPPDINRSEALFRLRCGEGRHLLRAGSREERRPPGNGSCGGGARGEGGPFRTIADFARRVDPKLVNKRAFESLARAGAFDALNPNRRQLVESSDIILNSAASVRARTRKRAGEHFRRHGRETKPKFASCRRWTGRRMNGCPKNSAPWAFIFPAIRSMPMPRRSSGWAPRPMPRCWKIAAAPASRRSWPAP